jgi:hypothetical protein
LKCFHCGASDQNSHEICTVCGRVVRISHENTDTGFRLRTDPINLSKKNPSLAFGLFAVIAIIIFGTVVKNQSLDGGTVSINRLRERFAKVRTFVRLWIIDSPERVRIFNRLTPSTDSRRSLPMGILSPMVFSGSVIQEMKCHSANFQVKYFKIGDDGNSVSDDSSADDEVTSQRPAEMRHAEKREMYLFRIRDRIASRREPCLFSYSLDKIAGISRVGAIGITFSALGEETRHYEYFAIPVKSRIKTHTPADFTEMIDDWILLGYKIEKKRKIEIDYSALSENGPLNGEKIIRNLPH